MVAAVTATAMATFWVYGRTLIFLCLYVLSVEDLTFLAKFRQVVGDLLDFVCRLIEDLDDLF